MIAYQFCFVASRDWGCTRLYSSKCFRYGYKNGARSGRKQSNAHCSSTRINCIARNFQTSLQNLVKLLENSFCQERNRQSRATVILVLASCLVLSPIQFNSVDGSFGSVPALAAKNRFAPGTNEPVVKDPEAILRNALPIENKTIRKIQHSLESIPKDIRTRSWSKIEQEFKQANSLLDKQKDDILSNILESRRTEARNLLDNLISHKLPSLRQSISQRDSEKITLFNVDILRDIAVLEEDMVKQFPYEVPKEFDHLPQLKGRAVVEMTIKKANNQKFDLDGQLFDKGQVTLVIDGYSAPVTGGCFVDLVNRRFYDGMKVIRSDGFVIQTGDPEGPDDGFVDPQTKRKRLIPLEVFAKGDEAPTYGITLEDDGRGAAATVLPFTSYGTLAMAREEFDANSASSQFFWLLFDPELTPAGRNLLDGRYAVFGYTINGQEYLQDFKVGDYVEQAKVTKGIENLKQPAE
ncbi:Peptidyl-prolyl cis-trans isomerase, chloroplastic [Galdieria sulphuraria]|uniref:peptidylprolyl isomerase n=1 Tax=Galdieria sulphuraria TaxID=130081 RepID=M2XYR0_GALSU|nr:peptidylprolyl isomerase [Galdieria sulphuraria]EME28798.1 peptidylprolyl isomerase [Galdieria sulphuraria]GJD07496.1 Peptidyl-prolyl cis-trans isomerase, chloroplastic [Galdieria sulphuraria]|eukprot:XP_005705318.1 peptidylprolyl isomerase [Galdieria sulphuraria]